MVEEFKSSYRKELYSPSAKKDRFFRVGQRRVNRVLETLRLVGNMGNRGLYDYNDAEVEKMFLAIENKLKEVRGKFRTERKDGGFRF